MLYYIFLSLLQYLVYFLEWYLVQTPNRYIAWVDSAALVTINPKELSHYKKTEKVVFKPVSGFSYSHPDNKSQTVSDLVAGCILPVTGSKNGFWRRSRVHRKIYRIAASYRVPDTGRQARQCHSSFRTGMLRTAKASKSGGRNTFAHHATRCA